MSKNDNLLNFKSRNDFQRAFDEKRDDIIELFEKSQLKVGFIDTADEEGNATVVFNSKKPDMQEEAKIISLVNDICEEISIMTGFEVDCTYQKGSRWSAIFFNK